MPFILLPSYQPLDIGYAAFDSDDFATTADPTAWPNTAGFANFNVGGVTIGSSARGEHMIYDPIAKVWLKPATGSGQSPVRSTDKIGTSWVNWSIPTGLVNISALVYDHNSQRLVAADVNGNVSWAPTWNGTWTNTVSGGTLLNRTTYADVGWNPLLGSVSLRSEIVFAGPSGVARSIDGGNSWTLGGTAQTVGLCYDQGTMAWYYITSTIPYRIYRTLSPFGTEAQQLVYVAGTSDRLRALEANPDTGTAIAIDWNQLNGRYYRKAGMGETWVQLNVSGVTDPLDSLVYDRDSGLWILGDQAGRMHTSSDDGSTWSAHEKVNNGSEFFNNVLQIGYTRRHHEDNFFYKTGSYATEVTDSAPEAWFRLGESSGPGAADSSGNGYTGTYVNSPTLGATSLVTTDADTAVTFARTSSQYITTNYQGPTGSQARTYSFIINTSDPLTTTADQTEILGHGTLGAGTAFIIRLSSADEPWGAGFIHVGVGSSYKVMSLYGNPINNGTDRHITVVLRGTTTNDFYAYDGGREMSIVEGSLATATTINTGTTNNVGIGWNSFGTNRYMQGTLDEVRIWERALTTREIVDQYVAARFSNGGWK